jgi:hypothetical protein
MGRLGGRKSHRHETDDRTLPVLANREHICEVIPRLFDEIYSGKLSPRTGSALLGVLNLQFRAIELANVHRRLDAIEQIVGPALDLGEPDETGDVE